MKDRDTNAVSATVVDRTDTKTFRGFVLGQVAPDAQVFTDDRGGYHGLPNHQTVKYSVGEYVDGMAHTNGIESFWSMLKRGYKGTYHRMSAKHLQLHGPDILPSRKLVDVPTPWTKWRTSPAGSSGNGCGMPT